MAASESPKRQKFVEELYKKYEKTQKYLLPKEKYVSIINELRKAESSTQTKTKTQLQYKLLRRYDILRCGQTDRLIRKRKSAEEPPISFVTIEETYDVIESVHLATGHGGRDKMLKELEQKFANVSRESVEQFKSHCTLCQGKARKTRPQNTLVRPVQFHDFSSRGQVDIVDFQSVDDGEYRWIMIYQDQLTQFVVLRPLTSRGASEVALQLADIFTLLGAPVFVQSGDGSEVTASVLGELRELWPDLRVLQGKTEAGQVSAETTHSDIVEMLVTWMTDNQTSRWSLGLRFVQFMRNRAYNAAVKKSPYRAMFGVEPRVGVRSTSLPDDVIDCVQTEDDLRAIVSLNDVSMKTEPTASSTADDPVYPTESDPSGIPDEQVADRFPKVVTRITEALRAGQTMSDTVTGAAVFDENSQTALTDSDCEEHSNMTFVDIHTQSSTGVDSPTKTSVADVHPISNAASSGAKDTGQLAATDTETTDHASPKEQSCIVDRQQFVQDLYQKYEKTQKYLLPTEKYQSIIDELKKAEFGTERKTAQQYKLLHRYEILHCGQTDRLIRKRKSAEEPPISFVTIEETYDVIESVHLATGHGGRDKMLKELEQKFANVSRESVEQFKSYCTLCQGKARKTRPQNTLVRPVQFHDFSSRGQVDIVDFQSVDDGEYRWIMIYQDQLTQFVVLRPLTSRGASEVALQLADIFTLLGAPVFVQSGDGSEVTASVLRELRELWPDLRVLQGKTEAGQVSAETTHSDIVEMLVTWMTDNQTSRWSLGLRFVQFMRNREYNAAVKKSPYRAMFGVEPRVGVRSTSLPDDVIDCVQTEDDLRAIVSLNDVSMKTEPTASSTADDPVDPTESDPSGIPDEQAADRFPKVVTRITEALRAGQTMSDTVTSSAGSDSNSPTVKTESDWGHSSMTSVPVHWQPSTSVASSARIAVSGVYRNREAIVSDVIPSAQWTATDTQTTGHASYGDRSRAVDRQTHSAGPGKRGKDICPDPLASGGRQMEQAEPPTKRTRV